jgi:hypothetical protein
LPDWLLVLSCGFTIKLWSWEGNSCSANMTVIVQRNFGQRFLVESRWP